MMAASPGRKPQSQPAGLMAKKMAESPGAPRQGRRRKSQGDWFAETGALAQ